MMLSRSVQCGCHVRMPYVLRHRRAPPTILLPLQAVITVHMSWWRSHHGAETRFALFVVEFGNGRRSRE